ncbi:MAG: glutaredoxin-related protein [uncultured archaeon A07HR60]|nr:MAG: glutaredoxin-related protein [uncultured archaeon A07HR60]
MTFDPSNQGPSDEEVPDIVADTIETNEIALFMKGNEVMPQCGYSKRAVELISQYRDDFVTVDVLGNIDAFREALETHSGWETTPQAFVKQSFVGGSDILAELDERGELADKLDADVDASATVKPDTDPDAASETEPDAPF